MNSVDHIVRWMEDGLAYVVVIDGWSYVCAQREGLELKCRPVPYYVLDDHYENEGDFAVWAPYREGTPAPWGRGHPTVNYSLVVEG